MSRLPLILATITILAASGSPAHARRGLIKSLRVRVRAGRINKIRTRRLVKEAKTSRDKASKQLWEARDKVKALETAHEDANGTLWTAKELREARADLLERVRTASPSFAIDRLYGMDGYYDYFSMRLHKTGRFKESLQRDKVFDRLVADLREANSQVKQAKQLTTTTENAAAIAKASALLTGAKNTADHKRAKLEKKQRQWVYLESTEDRLSSDLSRASGVKSSLKRKLDGLGKQRTYEPDQKERIIASAESAAKKAHKALVAFLVANQDKLIDAKPITAKKKQAIVDSVKKNLDTWNNKVGEVERQLGQASKRLQELDPYGMLSQMHY